MTSAHGKLALDPFGEGYLDDDTVFFPLEEMDTMVFVRLVPPEIVIEAGDPDDELASPLYPEVPLRGRIAAVRR